VSALAFTTTFFTLDWAHTKWYNQPSTTRRRSRHAVYKAMN